MHTQRPHPGEGVRRIDTNGHTKVKYEGVIEDPPLGFFEPRGANFAQFRQFDLLGRNYFLIRKVA